MLPNSNDISCKAWSFKYNTIGRREGGGVSVFICSIGLAPAFQQEARIPPFLSVSVSVSVSVSLSLDSLR